MNALYGMDTSFYSSIGAYSFEARCEMLKELGFDATYLTLWNDASWQDLPLLPTVKERYGLDVAAVYVTLDITGGEDHAGNNKIVQLVKTLEGCTTIEVNALASDKTLAYSDPAGDELLAKWLDKLLPIAEQRGITLALYPHVSCWLERVEDAVRICQRYQHPNLRAVFCGFHWYAVDGASTTLTKRLEEALPFLHLVNICGILRQGERQVTILPLDDGEMDNFALLGLLRRIGYNGKIGLQGYSVGGDVYTKLKRSIKTYRDMMQRLDQHPHWAELRPPK